MNINTDELTPKDITKLIEFLKNILGETVKNKSTISKSVHQELDEVKCPFCESNLIVKNGHTKNKIQRYKCKSCSRRFNDLSGTTCYHSKITFETWEKFFECMSDKLSIRKTAAKIGVNKNTAFAMRHKVLKALSIFNENVVLTGKIEADEVSIPINFKGRNKSKMPRASKKRKSASKKLNHKVCILGAIDSNDNSYLGIVGYGEITTKEIEESFGHRLNNAEYLITDCRSSYEKFASDHSLKLEQIKSKTYQNDNGYNLSEINGLHSNFFGFMSSFRGVSINHLQGYIDWFIYQKYINYAIEIIKQPTEILYYSIKQRSNITIKNIYKEKDPFDINEAYKDYNSSPII